MKILGNGVGTLYQEDKVIKGTFGLGKLKIPDDPDQATNALICDFQEAFDVIAYDSMTKDEQLLYQKFEKTWKDTNALYATNSALPKL